MTDREKFLIQKALSFALIRFDEFDVNEEMKESELIAFIQKLDDRMIVLQQTGDAPFRFEGRLITKVGGQHYRGKDVNRFFVIELYQSKTGDYILSISYQTVWDGEANRHDVLVYSTPEDVCDALVQFEAVPEGIGFPPGPSYQEKQERLLASLYSQYDDLVSELLTNAGSEFSRVN
jgi:hypothetical protein